MKTTEDGRVEIQIPFWGFYEGIHDSNLDDAIDNAFDYDYDSGDDIELDDKFYDAKWSADINWGDIHKGYAKAYTEEFGELFGLDLKFVELSSPAFYNFSTDRIFASIPKEQLDKLRKDVEAHEKWAECVKERFTSYDGFWSNYSNDVKDEEWTRDVLDECQYGVMIEFWIEHISDENEDWQAFLMDDFRGNGGIDDLVNDAVEAIKKYQKEVEIKDAINDINGAMDELDNFYLGVHNMPLHCEEAFKYMQEAVKKLEALNA